MTATSPYLFMAALLIRNALLPGSLNGVIFYLKPDLSKLNDMEVDLVVMATVTPVHDTLVTGHAQLNTKFTCTNISLVLLFIEKGLLVSCKQQ